MDLDELQAEDLLNAELRCFIVGGGKSSGASSGAFVTEDGTAAFESEDGTKTFTTES